MPSVVALIPARSGSERVPDKNIRPLAGYVAPTGWVRWNVLGSSLAGAESSMVGVSAR